jgi:hypothetical protein
MVILRKHQKEYALTPDKKRAIKLWFKDRFTEGLGGTERKELTGIAKKARTKLGRYILSPA